MSDDYPDRRMYSVLVFHLFHILDFEKIFLYFRQLNAYHNRNPNREMYISIARDENTIIFECSKVTETDHFILYNNTRSTTIKIISNLMWKQYFLCSWLFKFFQNEPVSTEVRFSATRMPPILLLGAHKSFIVDFRCLVL